MKNNDYGDLHGETCVCHWMSPAPVVMFPHVPVRAALGFMELRQSPYLVVVERGTVVGIVSRNHLQAAAHRSDDALTVGQVMRRDTHVLDAHERVERAAALMIERGLSYVPVADRGRLVGTLTIADALRAVVSRSRGGGVATALSA